RPRRAPAPPPPTGATSRERTGGPPDDWGAGRPASSSVRSLFLGRVRRSLLLLGRVRRSGRERLELYAVGATRDGHPFDPASRERYVDRRPARVIERRQGVALVVLMRECAGGSPRDHAVQRALRLANLSPGG